MELCCSLKTAARSDHPFKSCSLLHQSTNVNWSITDHTCLVYKHIVANTTFSRLYYRNAEKYNYFVEMIPIAH